MKKLLIGCLIFGCLAVLMGQTKPTTKPEPIKFVCGGIAEGMRIGDKASDEFQKKHWPAKDMGKPDVVSSDIVSSKDHFYIFYYFNEFKLIGVAVSFDTNYFPSMVAAYTEKFGAAPTLSTEAVKNAMGATFQNEIATWHTDSGDWVLQKYGSKLTQGQGQLNNAAFQQYLEEQAKKKADDLKGKI